ncbi:U2 protein [Cow vetch latent virus]|uniref:U2 protein n=1 Tax=Cow vetch latent virus TaxID=2056780 RepID=A0A2H4T2E4_9VIRU|nr:U2 protein [Cow vetch latent virus]ATY70085.1 U2 protein [Cow vetch latent virus]
MGDSRQPRLSLREVVQLKEEQDAFWVKYQNFLMSHEDMLGSFCRRHGRRVKAYPKFPSYGPQRMVNRYRIIFDVRLDQCSSCSESLQDVRQYSNPTKEDDWLPLFQNRGLDV